MEDKNLQQYWDRLLVEAFYKAPEAYVHRLVHQIMQDTGIDFEKLYSLKRVPRQKMHHGTTVARFCCGFIPKLGPILWKYNKDNIEHVLGIMDKWTRVDTSEFSPLDRHKDRERNAEFRRTRKKYAASTIASILEKENNMRNLRSGWNVCKPTNRKRAR